MWRRSQELKCEYCGIEEKRLAELQLRIWRDLRLETLGIDRIAGGDYRLGNIALCCVICNFTKRDVFTAEEMKKVLGPAIRVIWDARLARSAKEESSTTNPPLANALLGQWRVDAQLVD